MRIETCRLQAAQGDRASLQRPLVEAALARLGFGVGLGLGLGVGPELGFGLGLRFGLGFGFRWEGSG